MSVDQHDNDPVVLLTYVAVALDRVAPIDPAVFEALASPGATLEQPSDADFDVARLNPGDGSEVAALRLSQRADVEYA